MGLSDEDIQERRELLLVLTKEDLVPSLNKYIMSPVEKDQTSQVIFGANQENLQWFVSRGWGISRFVDGLSLQQGKYSQVEALENPLGHGLDTLQVTSSIGLVADEALR